MKQTLLIITAVMLVVGFTSGQEPIDGSTLVYKDDLMYAPGSDKPYSGVAVWYHENGQKESERTYKDGEYDGKWTEWHENGQKSVESTYKDDKRDGLYTVWNENGQKSYEVTYKDGEWISSKCWDEDGKETDCPW